MVTWQRPDTFMSKLTVKERQALKERTRNLALAAKREQEIDREMLLEDIQEMPIDPLIGERLLSVEQVSKLAGVPELTVISHIKEPWVRRFEFIEGGTVTICFHPPLRPVLPIVETGIGQFRIRESSALKFMESKLASTRVQQRWEKKRKAVRKVETVDHLDDGGDRKHKGPVW